MRKLILNIGLPSGSTVHTGLALHVLATQCDFRIHEDSVLQSDTEPTLVAVVSYNRAGVLWMEHAALALASRILERDCIAVWDVALNKGSLIGPQAREWGDFDPARFLMPDGRRLSECPAEDWPAERQISKNPTLGVRYG